MGGSTTAVMKKDLLNLIANTFWRTAPLGPTFSGPAVIIGLVVHVLQTVSVQARVRGAQPDAWLIDVGRLTERRSPVRNMLADAGVKVEMTWTAVVSAPQEGSYRRSRKPEYLPRH